MRFDPDVLTRLSEGDKTALDHPVEFDDGTVKVIRDCTRYDLAIMTGWLEFKAAEARLRLEEVNAVSRDRLGKVLTDSMAPIREIRRSSVVDERFMEDDV